MALYCLVDNILNEVACYPCRYVHSISIRIAEKIILEQDLYTYAKAPVGNFHKNKNYKKNWMFEVDLGLEPRFPVYMMSQKPMCLPLH